MIQVYPRGSTEQLSENFQAREFDCRCGKCPETKIDAVLVGRLQVMRNILRCPIVITSGYRCDEHQVALRKSGAETAKNRSMHQEGRAADIWTGRHNGVELEEVARMIGFTAVGLGRTFIHVDTRQARLAWAYEKAAREVTG